jgi:hypothetical protein
MSYYRSAGTGRRPSCALAIWQDRTDVADGGQHYRVRRLTDDGAGEPLAGWLQFEKVDL